MNPEIKQKISIKNHKNIWRINNMLLYVNNEIKKEVNTFKQMKMKTQ